MLIPLPGVKVFKNILGGEPDLFVNDFVKTGLKGYHKIVIPAQHWNIPIVHVMANYPRPKMAKNTSMQKKILAANEWGEVACTQGEKY